MPDGKNSKFSFYKCPNCAALYQLIKSQVGPRDNPQTSCGACSGELPARDGEFALKYFMLREAARTQKWKRPPVSNRAARRPRLKIRSLRSPAQ
jgi:hypothetical protein